MVVVILLGQHESGHVLGACTPDSVLENGCSGKTCSEYSGRMGVSTVMCLSQLSWGHLSPAQWCQPFGTQLPAISVLSTLQVTLARCGRGGVRKWSSLRSVFQGFNVSCRSGQASSQAFGADPGARGVRREEMELAEAGAGTSPVASDPVTAVQVPRGAVPSKQG